MIFQNTRIAQAGADNEFYATAFAEYVRDKQERYNELITLYNLCLALDTPLDDSTVDQFILDNSTFTNFSAYIPFNDGFIKLRDLLIQVSNYMEAIAMETPVQVGFKEPQSDNSGVESMSDVSYYGVSVGYAPTVPPEPIYDLINEYTNIIPLVDGLGKTIPEVEKSIVEIGDELQTQLHSVTSLLGAVLASAYESIPERISYFREFLNRTFTNAYDDMSNSASYYVTKLDHAIGSIDFMESLQEDFGLEQLADDETPTVLNDTNLALYTGASPIGPLDFGSTINAVTSTIKTGAKIIGNALSGIFNFAKKAITKVVDKVIQVNVNPMDLECINSHAKSFTISGWCYDGKDLEMVHQEVPLTLSAATALASKMPKAWQTRTIFADVLYTNCRWTASQSGDKVKIGGVVDFQYQLRAINPHLAIKAYEGLPYTDIAGLGLWSGNTLVSYLNRLKSFDGLYLDVDASEIDLARGFLASYTLSQILSDAILEEALYFEDESWYDLDRLAWPGNDLPKVLLSDQPHGLPDVVTNLDFVSLASGYDPSTNQFPREDTTGLPKYYIKSENYMYIPGRLLQGFIRNRVLREQYPTEYPFLPFTQASVRFDEPRFQIKTDAQNAQAFNKFWTTTVVVAIVAVVSVTAIIKVKKLASMASMRSAGLQRAYENKLATGTATKQDYKLMKRAKLKARVLGCGTSKLQSLKSMSSDPASADLSVVTDLIVGKN